MYKAAVMGDYDSIYGFATLGLDIFPITGEEEPGRLLRRLAESEYGVIYITEALAARIKTDIDRFAGQVMPVIVQIPGVSGNTGAGIRGVKKTVEQAVGSDILFGGENE